MANVNKSVKPGTETMESKDSRNKVNRRRGSRRGKTSRDCRRDSDSCVREIGPGNDFSYHNKFPDLMQSLLKYPWMHIQGTKLNVPQDQGTIAIGNVITAEFMMTPGVCSSPTDAYNLTSRDQWLELHRKYRGIGTYQQADYGITRLCIISLMIQILNAQRLYGIMHGYPVLNRVNPEGLIKCLGYSLNFINNLKNNLSDYRSRLNRIIVKARRLCLPNDLSVTKLWGGLASFVYKDSNNVRACYLAFNPAGFWRYAPKAMKTGTAAQFMRFIPSRFGSPFDLLKDLEDNLDILLTDDDVSRMCSDTIAAYGLENMESIKEFAEDYIVEAVYDESILIKFHNCVSRFSVNTKCSFVSVYDTNLINPDFYSKDGMYIYQNDNNIIFDPVFFDPTGGTKDYTIPDSTKHVMGPHTPTWTSVLSSVHDVPLLDTWEDTPSEATRCEALLWKNVFSVFSANIADQAYNIGIKPNFFGTEIIGNIRAHSVVGDTQEFVEINCFYVTGGNPVDDIGLNLLSQFDWAPFIYILNDVATVNPKFNGVIGDLDNYTIIDVSDVAPAIFDCSTLSLFKSNLSSNS